MTKPIRTSDRGDRYHLSVSSRRGLNLQLQSIRSSVQATIGFDRNRNGRLEQRETLARTVSDQSIATLTRSNLRSGTFLIRVAPIQQGDARDRLMLKPHKLQAGATRNVSNFVRRVWQLTNAFRQQNDLKPLRWNDRLAAAAQQHSQNMATQDFFGHQGLDGTSAQARGSASGYLGGIGENIAAGQTTPRAVVQAWIDSPPHRANLLNSRYRDLGVGFFDNPADRGLVNYRYYWTQNFGIPMQ
ncbi:CAP domain-containing protein [Microcoleus sp. FACHB-1515]|nr:CAP domain-containing protein [Microcoleus sp. FACHB-1515]